jgi:hypothetical protein
MTQLRCSIHPSHPIEGRFAIVTNAAWDAVDAEHVRDDMHVRRTAKSCGLDALAAGVSSHCAVRVVKTVTNKPSLTGESTYKP